jgi:hypothetical protein
MGCPKQGGPFSFSRKEGEVIRLQLDEGERTVLHQLLESCISDLHDEIANTDNADYKDMLKGRKAVVVKLLEALQTAEIGKARS